jgi:hypothetical protein
MKLRVVALPLFAAICWGSPAMANTSTDEQMVRGRGARDRSSDGNGGGSATTRGGGDNGGGRATTTRGGGDNGGGRATTRADDGDQGRNRPSGRDNGPRVAVPRDRDRGRDNGPRVIVQQRPNVNINFGPSFRGPRYYSPFYYDRWARNYYRWSPIRYAPWGLIYGSVGFSNFGYYSAFGSPYPYGPYGYGYGAHSPWQASGYDIGGVRLKIRPRDAQVFVDGYYAGLVDDFDGSFQSLRLEQGGHKIEIHMPGFEDLELDVHVQAGRTITLNEDLRPRP